MTTKLEISRGPHGLRVHLPRGRTLDISTSAAGAKFLEQMLRDMDNHAHYGEHHTPYSKAFPTQEIVKLFERANREREDIEAQVAEIKERKAQEKLAETKAKWADLGINIDELTFD